MASVEIGDWSYSGDPLRIDREEVRLRIADNDPTNQLLSDREIDAAIQLAQSSGNPAGTLSVATLAVNGTFAAGATSIDLDATTVTGTAQADASFTIVGSTQRYFLTGEITAAGNALDDVKFWPGLAATAADGAAVHFRLFDIHEAVAICHEHLAAKYAKRANVTIDGRSEQWSSVAALHLELARAARRQSTSGGAFGVPLVRV